MIRNIGCEVGNYDTKLMTRDDKVMSLLKGREGVVVDDGMTTNVLNVVSRGSQRRSLGSVKPILVNLLDVTITTKDKQACGRWFVGALAIKEGVNQIKPTREDEKYKNPITNVLMLTTLAYSLFDPNEAVKTERVRLGTLLPTEEYFTEGAAVQFKEKLVGTHTIKFNDPAFEGAIITLTIEKDIEILPEGAAGQTATTFDWDGNPFDEEYENKTIMNIDIGSVDTDVSIMEEAEFKSKGFFGLKGGTKDVLRGIASEINQIHGHTVDTHKLDHFIRFNKLLKIGTIEVKDLQEIAERHYDEHAWTLANELTEQLKDRQIDKGSLHEVNLIGGGPEFFEKGIVKHFGNSSYMSIKVAENARFKNVEGVLKTLLFRLAEKSSQDDGVYEESAS